VNFSAAICAEDQALNTIALRAMWCLLLVVALAAKVSAQATIVGPTQSYPLYTPSVPSATLEGNIQPVDPGWDPYADPFQQATPDLTPQGGNIVVGPDGTFAQRERLIQQIRLDATYLLGDGGQDLGVVDIETNLTAAFPFAYGVAPLLVTPGFAFHLWNGPDSTAFPGSPDMPGATYSSYLDFGWRPQITPHFSADFGVRPGLYGDYQFFNEDTFRIKARALGIFTPNPQFQWVFGVLYLDRLNLKILPAGGLIWTPREGVRWEILFPRPKFSACLTTWGNTEIWWFVAAEYGGDSWTIERPSGAEDYVDYSDYRASIGLEWTTLSNYRGFVEFGYVFERLLDYDVGPPGEINPDETFMFRGGIAF
jgi:hypothetical protein